MGMTKKFVHDLANGLAVENYVWNRGRNVHDTARSSIIFLGEVLIHHNSILAHVD